MQVDRLRDVVRVEGEAGLRDVAEDAGIVAVDEVREVWADQPALHVDGVAFGARRVVAEELLPPARPTSAIEFLRRGEHKFLAEGVRLRVRPREQDPAERDGPLGFAIRPGREPKPEDW